MPHFHFYVKEILTHSSMHIHDTNTSIFGNLNDSLRLEGCKFFFVFFVCFCFACFCLFLLVDLLQYMYVVMLT